MGQTPVAGVKRVSSKESPQNPLPPGGLARDDQGQWDFVGNGETTPSELTATILQREVTMYGGAAKGLPAAMPPDLQKEFTQELLNENPQWNLKDPNQPIPKGQEVSTNVDDLKRIIQPFLNNPEMQRYLAGQVSSVGAKYGDVRNPSLSLPYIPNEPG